MCEPVAENEVAITVVDVASLVDVACFCQWHLPCVCLYDTHGGKVGYTVDGHTVCL
ncbi:hypothetical protein NHG28_06130 [Aerococcaceae bacterium NML201209]|nr:hypothetical protein [Aerococcaceae bacterium NML201209]MCW6665092.1 hypothetical protein [Aerococcaceae bacterium NML191219]